VDNIPYIGKVSNQQPLLLLFHFPAIFKYFLQPFKFWVNPTNWNLRDSPLSCVLLRYMFIFVVETQWLEKQRNQFWKKKRERETVNFDHKISSPPTQICLWWFADCFVQLHENIFPLLCFQEACLVVLEQHPCLVNNSSSKQEAHFLVRRQEGCLVHQHQAQHPQVLELALALEEPRVSLDRVLLDKQ